MRVVSCVLLLLLFLFVRHRASAQVPPPDSVPVAGSTSLPRPDTLPSSPQVAASATRILAGHGFANVAVLVADGRVAATFENTRYRDERRALREAARLLAPLLRDHRELVLALESRGIPVAAARFAAPPGGAISSLTGEEPAGAHPTVSLDVSALPPALHAAPRTDPTFGRLEVVVHPWIEAQLGDFDDPVQSRLGLAPELRVPLRRGMTLSAQLLFALQDELFPDQSAVRPGVATLNQTVRLARRVFLSATAGAFTRDRYGVDLEGRAFSADGRWAAGAQVGMTGAADYARDGWRFGPMDGPVALADVARRIARYDLTLQATAGWFLDGDGGVRLDVRRRFGELEVGWFALRTGGGSNGGVVLRVPLPPPAHAARGRVRLRVADAFRWEYRYRGLERAGRRHDTGSRLEELGRRFDPDRLAGPR